MNLHLIRFALLIVMAAAIVGAHLALGNGQATRSQIVADCSEPTANDHFIVTLEGYRQASAEPAQRRSATVAWKHILPGVLR